MAYFGAMGGWWLAILLGFGWPSGLFGFRFFLDSVLFLFGFVFLSSSFLFVLFLGVVLGASSSVGVIGLPATIHHTKLAPKHETWGCSVCDIGGADL